ncbi:hypothetical protein [Amnibacterium kyonggiense]
MSVGRAAEQISRGRELFGSRWWLRFALVGVVLLLAPVAAIAVTNRDPDPVFMHFWWTPIARSPTPALLVGSLGLDLLTATGFVALICRLSRRRRPTRPRLRAAATIAMAAVLALVWSLGATSHADASRSSIARVLDGDGSRATKSSRQATGAVAQVLAWPTDPTSRVHILRRPSVPAGPWIVQTTEVLNENAQDEGADVVLETLVDPIDGGIVAAWYYGM